MVSSATSYTGNGLRDWLLQRLTALYMLFYTCVAVFYLVGHPMGDYEAWAVLAESRFVRISTLLFITCLLIHAWIGMWTIATDYLKPTAIRLGFYVVVWLMLIGCFLWSLEVLWGV